MCSNKDCTYSTCRRTAREAVLSDIVLMENPWFLSMLYVWVGTFDGGQIIQAHMLKKYERRIKA